MLKKITYYALFSIPVTLGCILLAEQPDVNKALKKQVKDQTFEEATLAKEHYEKKKDTELVIQCSERMITVGGNSEKDSEVIRKTMQQLIEISLNNGKLDIAQKYALEYQTLYPGDAECKQVSYLAIKAHFLATLGSDRDQSKTEKTIELARQFLQEYPQDSTHTKDIKDILEACYTKLLQSEISVINSYISRYNYNKKDNMLTAAQKRLDYVKNSILPHVTKEQEQVSSIELRLAKISKKKYPTSDKTLPITSGSPVTFSPVAEAKISNKKS